MKDRILEFLKKENKTSSQFAEEIGVQPSSISHILSGRNKPSLDFITKMLIKYPLLSTDWLIFGKEPMYSASESGAELDFDSDKQIDSLFGDEEKAGDSFKNEIISESKTNSDQEGAIKDMPTEPSAQLRKVILLYGDGSFREYKNPLD